MYKYLLSLLCMLFSFHASAYNRQILDTPIISISSITLDHPYTYDHTFYTLDNAIVDFPYVVRDYSTAPNRLKFNLHYDELVAFFLHKYHIDLEDPSETFSGSRTLDLELVEYANIRWNYMDGWIFQNSSYVKGVDILRLVFVP